VQALIFPDIGLKTLGSNSTGASFTWPKLVAGDDVRLKLRIIETIAGEKVLSRRTISAMKLSVGRQDVRPTSGSFQLKLGADAESAGVNTTAAIAYGVTDTDLATILNALTDAALTAKKPFTVAKRNDSWHIRAADSSTVTWAVVDNALLPQSLVDIRSYSFDEGTSYELRLTQTVLCEQTNFDPIVPDLASVSVIQVGTEESGVKRNTIQQIFFPPELSEAYSFRLRWGFRRTAAIDSPADAESIQAALEAVAEEGETVTVTDGEDRVLIEFSGDTLSGTSVAALVIEHLVTPAADSVITMATATDGMAKYMATIANAATGLTEFKLPLSLKLWLVGEQDEEEEEPLTFISEVTFQKPVSLEAFANAAVLNPTRPLSNRSHLPFSPTQITETQRGYLLTGGTALGDGSADEFQVDHNLGTRHVYVALFDSAVDGQMLKHGTDYEVEIVSDNAILIIFTTPPASGGVVGGICTVASTAAFVDLEINIGQVIGLEDRLSAAEEAVATLQATAGVGSLGSPDEAIGATILEIDCGTFAEIYPSRVALDEVERIADITAAMLPKDSALLPAIHDAVVETLPDPLPTPGTGNAGKVYRNAGASADTLAGGGGRRGVTLKVGEFCASDGRYLYKVARQSAAGTAKTFTADNTTDVITSAAHGWDNGQAVMMSSTTALPGNLAVETQYFVIDKTTDTFKVSLTSGGSAVDISSIGTGTHSIFTAPAATFYPSDFEREIPLGSINGDMLSVRRTLEVRLGIELAILNAKTPTPRISDNQSLAQWEMRIEWGTRTSESSPATPDTNIKAISWNTTPILTRVLDITSAPTVHTLGARIKRTGASTWTAEKSLYGLWQTSAATINAADFFLRARLTRFDVTDIADARGFVALIGTHVATGEDSSGIGTLTIK